MEILKFRSLDWIILCITTLLLLVGFLSLVINEDVILPICATIINFLFIVKFYRSIPLFILFVFIFLYTKTFNFFFIDNINISFWTDFQTLPILQTVLINHLFFIFFLGNLIPGDIGRGIEIDIRSFFVSDKVIYFLLFGISIPILLFSLSGETIFQSGSYNNGDFVEKSTLHEYFILLFLFMTLFSPRGKVYYYTQSLLLFVYIIKTLLYGGRIEVIQISLLFFYIHYVFKNKVKTKYIIIIITLGLYLSGAISYIRSNPQEFLQGDISRAFIPSGIFGTSKDVKFISSNEGDVIQSSARIVGLIETNDLNNLRRVTSFMSYLVSPIIPGSLLPQYANLATYKQDLYQSGGGGLISTYFYAWFGYCGPIIIAIIISIIIRMFYRFKSKNVIVYGICLLFTFPRWFAYNPIFLVKFCFYAIILLCSILLYQASVKKIFKAEL